MNSEAHRACLWLIGVGPGDPELLTLKAARLLAACPVWAAPVARAHAAGGESAALAIAQAALPEANPKILRLDFLMRPVTLGRAPDPEQAAAWNRAAEAILAELDAGRDVAFPTLGDVGLYSTAFYVLEALRARRPDAAVRIVPGITAMSACSAGQMRPLALGDDLLTVVPAAFDDERLRGILETCDAVVLMKVHKKFEALLALLEELGLTDRAVLVERAGLPEERVFTDIRRARGEKLHYFSTILVRKKSLGSLS